jgi:hypothetical protein
MYVSNKHSPEIKFCFQNYSNRPKRMEQLDFILRTRNQINMNHLEVDLAASVEEYGLRLDRTYG